MRYLFTGSGRRAYQDYVDVATGRMLEAEPGGQYEIRATWDVLPAPPADGFWEAIAPADGDPEAAGDAPEMVTDPPAKKQAVAKADVKK